MAKAKSQNAAPQASDYHKPKIDRAARHKEQMEQDAAKVVKVARGTARANRRSKAASAGLKGADFKEVWQNFKAIESGKTTLAEVQK